MRIDEFKTAHEVALEELTKLRARDIFAVLEAAQRVADWGWGSDAPAECQTDFIDLRAALEALDIPEDLGRIQRNIEEE